MLVFYNDFQIYLNFFVCKSELQKIIAIKRPHFKNIFIVDKINILQKSMTSISNLPKLPED